MENSPKIHIKIIRPDGLFYEKIASSIVFPDKDGQRAIFPQHIPFVCALGIGIVKVSKSDNDFDFFYLEEGLLENKENQVIILSYTIKKPSDFDKNILDKRLMELQASLPHDKNSCQEKLEEIKKIKLKKKLLEFFTA